METSRLVCRTRFCPRSRPAGARVRAGDRAAIGQLELKIPEFLTAGRLLLIAAFIWAVFPANHARAADRADSLAGPAFVYPQEELRMPSEWRNRPIRHATPAPVDLAITLDQQMYPALLPLIRDFRDKEGIEIAVSEGTCGTTAGAISEKKADIGGYCCPPGPSDRLPGLRFHTIGIGPVALIVHPDNPIDDISLDEARSVFSGKINRWSELSGWSNGGEGNVIRPVIRLHCKLRPGHWRRILDNEDLFDPMSFDAAGIIDMIRAVSRNRLAIGFAHLWQIDRYAGEVKVKVLSLNGASPRDRQALARGEYPFYRVFNLTTWDSAPAANPRAVPFVRYIRQNLDRVDPGYHVVGVDHLHGAGWIFAGSELVGEPK